MLHEMFLGPEPFDKISCGQKTIEMRLYDKKRQRVNVGDYILFSNTEIDGLTALARVKSIHIFPSFTELYAHFPLTSLGYDEDTMANASPEDMGQYYFPELQQMYGAVGFEIEVVFSGEYDQSVKEYEQLEKPGKQEESIPS